MSSNKLLLTDIETWHLEKVKARCAKLKAELKNRNQEKFDYEYWDSPRLWNLLKEKYVPLLGHHFRKNGEDWRLSGLVRAEDGYYYLMTKVYYTDCQERKLETCDVDLEDDGYEWLDLSQW